MVSQNTNTTEIPPNFGTFQKFPISNFWTDRFDILEPQFYAVIFMERSLNYFFGIYIILISQYIFTNILVVYRKVNILFYHVLKKIFPDFIFRKVFIFGGFLLQNLDDFLPT